MKRLYFLAALLIATTTHAQTELHVGDKVPEDVWAYLAAQKSPALQPASLKSKLVILDFWATTCTSCFGTFREVDSLQKQFDGRLQWVMVTKDSKQKVDAALAKLKKVKMPSVPAVEGDTVLSKWFYYATVPHHVWLDSTGKVRAVTPGYNTVAKTIQKQLSGGDPKLYEKREVKNYRSNNPWSATGNVEYYSYISKRVKERRGGGMGTEKDSVTKKIIQIHAENSPVLELMKMAYSKDVYVHRFHENNRLVVEAKNREKYFMPEDLTQYDYWADENTFNYMLKVPVSFSGKLYDFMQQDMQRAFGLKGTIEKRRVRCLVLKSLGKAKFASAGAKRTSHYNEEEHRLKYVNSPVEQLVAALSLFMASDLPTPVVDGTGYKGMIDVDLVVRKGDVEGVKAQLKTYGITLVEEEQELEMLVIKDVE